MAIEEWVGHWWLPQAPDEQLPGVLKQAEDDQLTLSLIGGFKDLILRQDESGVIEVSERSQPWSVIQGIARGKKLTLLDCASKDSKTYGWGLKPDEQKILANTLLVGIHLSDVNEELFSAVEVRIECLGEWVAESPFSKEIILNEGQWTGSATVKVERLPTVHAQVDELTISLRHDHTMPVFEQRNGERVAHMAHRPIVRIETPALRSLDKVQDNINVLQDLVSFAAHSACAVISRTLLVPSKFERQTHIRVQHFARQVVQSTLQVSRTEFLFTLADISFRSRPTVV